MFIEITTAAPEDGCSTSEKITINSDDIASIHDVGQDDVGKTRIIMKDKRHYHVEETRSQLQSRINGRR